MTQSAQAPVGYGPVAEEVNLDKEISTATRTSTASTKSTLLGCPLEIRERIYEFACDEVIGIKSDNYINPGRSLLLVSRQIHNESKPFIYRTLTIDGRESMPCLTKLLSSSNRWDYTRRLDIRFTCYCNMPTEDPDWEVRDFPDTQKYFFQRDQWSTVLTAVENFPSVEELCITFDTCCRKKLRFTQDSTGHMSARQGIVPPIISNMDH